MTGFQGPKQPQDFRKTGPTRHLAQDTSFTTPCLHCCLKVIIHLKFLQHPKIVIDYKTPKFWKAHIWKEITLFIHNLLFIIESTRLYTNSKYIYTNVLKLMMCWITSRMMLQVPILPGTWRKLFSCHPTFYFTTLCARQLFLLLEFCFLTSSSSIDHFTDACLAAWYLNESDAGVMLMVLFSC